MGGPPIAVEALGVGIGIEVKSLDLPDAGGAQAVHDIGFEVEMRLAPGRIGEEARVGRVRLDKAEAEGVVHFVRGLGDAGSDRGADMLAPCAEPLHRDNGRVGHPGERAAPAGVGRANHAGFGVGKQHGRAVGGEDTEQEIRPVGDHRVGARALVLRPRVLGFDDIGRVNLMNGDQLGPRQQRSYGEAARSACPHPIQPSIHF